MGTFTNTFSKGLAQQGANLNLFAPTLLVATPITSVRIDLQLTIKEIQFPLEI